MSKQRKSAYGAPQEQKEVVITMDRRLAAGAGLVGMLLVALAGGVWWARHDAGGPPTSAAAAAPSATPSGPVLPSDAQLAADLAAAGLPPSAVVIKPNVPIAPEDNPFTKNVTPSLPESQPTLLPPGFAPPAVGTRSDIPVGGIDITTALPPESNRPGELWEPDVLVGMPDPNLSAEYTPLRPEDVESPLAGPRIAISDLNEQYSYNYGTVPMNRVAEHEFEASNVGDKDLIISRIYASCGCTATVFGGITIKDDGFLPEPVTLRPGESRPFVVQFDPRAEGKAVTQAKYIQIYSNDATRFLFDDTKALSYEVRFRIVVKPE